MCGIVGTYGRPGSSPSLEDATDALAHRGPDARGIWADDQRGISVRFGHRRLSIVDLSSAADQPLVKDGLAIAYNGEIYNYAELRAELVASGVRFDTTSDTEVVLEGWRRWGTDVLARLRGMFAFALFERATGDLVLARDPIGIKPLFVHHDRRAGWLAFGSELKALTKLVPGRLEIDDTAIAGLLLYDFVPEDRCIYRDVEKLPAGSWLRMRPDGTTSTGRYWTPDSLYHPAHATTADDVGRALEDSVRAHLIADVEIGAFLSGGLDSSVIAAIGARQARRLRCFTIRFRDQDRGLEAMPDDLTHARRVARHLGLDLAEIEVAPVVADLLPAMVEILDEPLGDAAAINVVLLSRAAREAGLKVVLSGMGADELFGGYRRHRASLLASRYRRLPAPLRAAVRATVNRLPVALGGRGLTPIRWAQRFLAIAGHDEEAAYRRSYTYYEPADLADLLGEAARPQIDDLCRRHAEIYWRSGSGSGDAAQLLRMRATDLAMFLPALNLAYTDRASMAASIEVRVPFVDPRVIEVAFALPPRELVHGGVQKVALKTVAERWLPHDIVHRPKASFGMPLRTWTVRDLRPIIRDVLPRGELVARGLIRREPLVRMLDANEQGKADHAQAIWQLLTLETWLAARRAA